MSKERELLKEFIDFVDSYEFYPTERSVIWEIVNRANAILAQPESTAEAIMPNGVCVSNVYAAYEEGRKSVMVEQEPVAWMYDHQIEVGYDKYTEVNIIETCARNLESNNCINIRPLYLAPPKREPLINIYVLNAFKADDEATHPYSYWAGVEFAEKHHGIGGGE